jgi:cardiolipin synthase
VVDSQRGVDGERVVTVPNLLTLSRLPLAGVVWVDPGDPALVIPLLAIAAVTDILDGRVARAIRARRRRRGKESGNLAEAGAIGAWLDPLCDKVFVLSVLVGIYVGCAPPTGVVLLTGLREIILVPLALGYRLVPGLREQIRFDFRAGPIGKLATVTQFATAAAVLLALPVMWPLAWLAGATGLAAAVAYLRRAVRSHREVVRASDHAPPPPPPDGS